MTDTRTKDQEVTAQHEETGRLWHGPRSRIPLGYCEVQTGFPSAVDAVDHNAEFVERLERQGIVKLLDDGGFTLGLTDDE